MSGLNGSDGIGQDGDPGPVIYPAGYWNSTTTYVTTSEFCPYVYHEGNFYILKSDTSVGHEPGLEPSIWEQVEGFEAIYTDVLLARQALVGSSVFHGDYMYSQQGINNVGAKTTYADYRNTDNTDYLNGEFTPNIKFNFADGSGHLAGGKFKWYKDSSDEWVVDIGGSTEPALTEDDVKTLINNQRASDWGDTVSISNGNITNEGF